jgi:hypothetical protein
VHFVTVADVNNVPPFWSGPVAAFLATPTQAIVGTLAEAQIRHHRTNEVQQLRAWEETIKLLRASLAGQHDAGTWWLLLEYPMLRLGRRADAILLTPRAILVLEFKAGARHYTSADREQVEDYALDLCDFHAASRRHPVVPILVATDAPQPRPATQNLPIHGLWNVIDANAASLPNLLRDLARTTPIPTEPLDPRAWCDAAYRPVPTIVEAACMLYARHGVPEIKAARADAENLSVTTDAIVAAIEQARLQGRRLILFVTGIPGAGKTLCGLNAAFGLGADVRATFLTGNPTLVHVLREALARDAIAGGADRRAARQKMESAIQALPRFRDHHVAAPNEIPAESIVVVDEAQRCWSTQHAIGKTRDRPVRLSMSEPAHLLQIMSRHQGFAAMICLVGGGQEIHDGEGGLAEWGEALRACVGWRVLAAPDIFEHADARQRLGNLADLHVVPELHLSMSVRQIRFTKASAWVNHVLAGDHVAASRIADDAGPALPYRLTRSLPAMRAWLRAASRGQRRAGLLASAGAKRLRAEGLGAELPHMDAMAVAHWFLDRFPDDVRASNALEVVATEFSCQGLELDFCGLCWDADLVREPARTAWRVQSFRGTTWQRVARTESIANQINTYRVLLTRARYDTVIFVPAGDAADRTRDPVIYDGIASFLQSCGARTLAQETEHEVELPETLLL